jgi:hypothetical protein
VHNVHSGIRDTCFLLVCTLCKMSRMIARVSGFPTTSSSGHRPLPERLPRKMLRSQNSVEVIWLKTHAGLKLHFNVLSMKKNSCGNLMGVIQSHTANFLYGFCSDNKYFKFDLDKYPYCCTIVRIISFGGNDGNCNRHICINFGDRR